MSETYTIVIVKRPDEWIAACEFGEEEPGSEMVGGAAYGVAPTAGEAIDQVLQEMGLPTQQVPAQAALPKSIADVAAERATHEGRGWTAEHDRRHGVHHLVQLAQQYTHRKGPAAEEVGVYDRTYMVKAASLLVAAIDLLDVLAKEERF